MNNIIKKNNLTKEKYYFINYLIRVKILALKFSNFIKTKQEARGSTFTPHNHKANPVSLSCDQEDVEWFWTTKHII